MDWNLRCSFILLKSIVAYDVFFHFSTVMKDIEAHYKDPNLPYPSEENPLLFELTSYVESMGISNPCLKVKDLQMHWLFSIKGYK